MQLKAQPHSAKPIQLVTPRLIALAIETPILAGIPALYSAAMAQVIPDNTLGAEQSILDSATVQGNPADLITGGASRGANLFHSFLEFNVNEGQRVYFSNPENIDAIFSRVTGGNPSNIFGTLGVDGAANLFLMNPNGVVFGPNAQLDLQGAFWASTAESIEFEDGSVFSARNPQAAPLVTVNIPVGLQFAADAPAAVRNSGQLAAGMDLRLSGGEVVSEGSLVAGGLVKLEGVAGDVRISGSEDLGGRSLQANAAELTAAGDVVLEEGQLQTTQNLTLSARNKLRVRDSETVPIQVSAGGDLLLQGDVGIDILALNHPQTPFVSQGDLTLVSDGIISGDAHFTSQGDFAVETLAGEPGEFVSLYDPVVRSSSNVEFGSYEGTSLLVEAAGSISATGDITITGPDEAPVQGANANNANSNDVATLSSRSALILRAGKTVAANQVELPPQFTAQGQPETPASVIVGGDIETKGNAGGLVDIEAPGNITLGGNIIAHAYTENGNTTVGKIKLSSAGGSVNIDAENSTETITVQAAEGATIINGSTINIRQSTTFSGASTALNAPVNLIAADSNRITVNFNSGTTTAQQIIGSGGDDIFNFNGDFTGDIDGAAGKDQFTFNSGTINIPNGSIRGGEQDDIFTNSGASISASLSGDAGDDKFEFSSGSVSGNADGGAGDDTFQFSGGSVAGRIIGGENNAAGDRVPPGDTLIGVTNEINGVADSNRDIFTLTGPGSGTIAQFTSPANTTAFEGIENLRGGEASRDAGQTANDGNDRFRFVTENGVSGSIGTVDGGGGTDMLDYSGYGDASSDVTVNFNSTAPNSTTGVGGPIGTTPLPGIDGVIGSSNNNTRLVGIAAPNLYTVAISANNIGNNDPNEIVIFNVGTLDGNGGEDELSYRRYDANAVRVELSNSSNTSGPQGIATINSLSTTFSGISKLSGSQSSNSQIKDELIVSGDDSSRSTFSINSATQDAEGEVRIGDQEAIAFSSFEVIDGGSGDSTLQGADDPNITDRFSLDGNGAGTVQVGENPSIQFRQIQTLEGRKGNDSFEINAGGAIANPINGGLGQDTIVGLDATSPADEFQVTGDGTGTLNESTQNIQFTDIEVLDGRGGDTDRLLATAADDTFSFTSATTGQLAGRGGETYDFDFANVERLVGGEGANQLQGSDGGDVIAIASLTDDLNQASGTIQANNQTEVTVGFEQIQSVDGQGGDDQLAGLDSVAENDQFQLTAPKAGTLNGRLEFADIEVLDGRGGTADAVIGSDGPDQFAVDQPIAEGVQLRNIELLDGGNNQGGLDSLSGSDDANVREIFQIGSSNGQPSNRLTTLNRSLQFDNIERLEGRAGNDRFVVESGGSLTGELDGGAGNDEFTIGPGGAIEGGIAGGAGGDRFTLSGGELTGTVEGNEGNDIFELRSGVFQATAGQAGWQGGAGNDAFRFTGGTFTGTVEGNEGADEFNLSGTAFSGELRGGNDADRFNFLSDSVQGTANGGDGDDVFTLGGLSSSVSLQQIDLEGGGGDDDFVFRNGSRIRRTIQGGDGSQNGPADGTDEIRFENYGPVSAIAEGEFEGKVYIPGNRTPEMLIVDYQSIEGLAGDENSANEILGTENADNFVVTEQVVSLNGIDQPLGSTQLVNFTTLNGIEGDDQFFLRADGEIGAIRAGAGNDIVYLQGGKIINRLDGEGGKLTLVANPNDLQGLEGLPPVVTGGGAGSAIAIQPAAAGGEITITEANGNLQYNGSSLSPIQQSTFGNLIIGHPEGSSLTTLGTAIGTSAINFEIPTTIQNGAITVLSEIESRGRDLTFIAREGIFDASAAQLSTVGSNGANSGSIIIQAEQGAVRINSINTAASGSADAGDVSIVGDSVAFPDLAPSVEKPQRIDAAASGSGRTGAVDITALLGNVTLSNGAIFVDTLGQNNLVQGGDLSITANQGSIQLDAFDLGTRIRENAITSMQGSAIRLTANSEIMLANESSILSSIDVGATGRAGTVRLNAPTVKLDQSTISSTVAGTAGAVGSDIKIETEQFSLNDGASLAGNVIQNATGAGSPSEGSGGQISVKATTTDISEPMILIDSTSRIESRIDENTSGNGTDITLEGASIQLEAGATVRASNAGAGNGGTIQLRNLTENAPENQRIKINGTPERPTILQTTVSGRGQGSKIKVQGGSVEISGASIQTETSSNVSTGVGGAIEIKGQRVDLVETTISTSTTGAARSGDVVLGKAGENTTDENVREESSLNLERAQILSTASGTGSSGQIRLQATEIQLSQGKIQTDNRGSGTGGGVEINGDRTVQTNQSSITTNTSGTGTGGQIDVQATDGEIRLSGAQLQSTSQATGSGGDISLNAKGNVTLEAASVVETSTASGAGGNVEIAARSVELTGNRATDSSGEPQFSTRINTSTSGSGAGGQIDVKATAGEIRLSGAQLQSTSQATESGGDINLSAAGGNVTLEGASVIETNTANGAGGSVSVTGDRVQILGTQPSNSESSGTAQPNTTIRTSSSGIGEGGGIEIVATGMGQPPLLSVETGSANSIEAQTANATVENAAIRLSDGAQISTTGSSSDGGNIMLTAAQGDIALTGAAKIEASTRGTAQAGDIDITAQTLLVQGNLAADKNPIDPPIPNSSLPDEPAPNPSAPNPNRSEIITRSEPAIPGPLNAENPRGEAGNINITAGTVRFDYGALIADTEETNRDRKQGNINLTSNTGGQLQLQNESLISARGSTPKARGGNILIEGFSSISGGPSQPGFNGSDIVTSADRERRGGVVIIRSPIFNFEEQFAEPGNATNDISSDGDVEVLDPGLDRGLREVDFEFVDLNSLVGQECRVGESETGSRFTLSGRGGISRSPLETLPAEFSGDQDWVVLEAAYGEPLDAPMNPEEGISAASTSPKRSPTIQGQCLQQRLSQQS